MEIKDIENLAELAKIELTEEEKMGLLKDMEGILDYVKQIQEVKAPARNTEGIASAGGDKVEPEYQNKNTWREDQATDSLFSRDLILKQIPDKKDDFVKVKKVL